MSRRVLTEPELLDAIRGVEQSACRWEQQRFYVEPGEAELIAEFEAGGAGHPPFDHPWVAMLADFKGTGRRMARVRVQDTPLTPYQRWLAAMAARWNIPAGEDIRVIPRRRVRVVGRLMRVDWWLLDRRQLIVFRFDRDGRRVVNELMDGRVAVTAACLWWDLAVRYSTPATMQGVLTTT